MDLDAGEIRIFNSGYKPLFLLLYTPNIRTVERIDYYGPLLSYKKCKHTSKPTD